MNMPNRRTARTMCPMNCHPTFCGMQVTIENDRVVEVEGDPENPDSQGFLCVRGLAAKEIPHNGERILYPMVRDDRTAGNWRRVSWDEALDRIVTGLNTVGREAAAVWPGHGAIANDFGLFAHAQLALRFANMWGCQWWEPSMICWGLGGFGTALTGAIEANTKEDMSANADLIVLWGSNLVSQPNTAHHIALAKRRRTKVVAIDVRVSEACRSAHEYFLVRPGTDAALALALMHVIVRDGLHDREFIAAHTVGFDALAEHLATCTPEWAANITGVPAAQIESLAHLYASTERAMILMGGSSLYKDRHGWQASRAISCLPALTGKLGKSGAGLGPRHNGNPHGQAFNLIINFPARPPGDYVPPQMSAIVDAIESGRLRAMLVFGSNFISSFADAARVARGFERMDLVVCHDLFMNETMRRYAHVVLPATSWLEDVGVKVTATHAYLMDRVLPPAGETRSMSEIVRALADRLGVADFYPWEPEVGHVDAVLNHPSSGQLTVAALRAGNGIAPLKVSHVAHPDHRYATPSGKIELHSKQAEAVGLPPLPSYTVRETGAFPLELRTGRSINHFHAFYDHGRALPALARREPGPQLWISPADAAKRGIEDGAAIRIHNDRGECRAGAHVTDRVPDGTVWMHDGWEGLNTLTNGGPSLPDSALGLFTFTVGQAAYDARVDVAAL